MILSFCFFLFIFIAIGVFSTLQSRYSNADYLLADQNVKPWLVALSAVATNNSGYMFIGMIGYTYLYGASSVWLMFGFIIGDFMASLLVHKNLRKATDNSRVLSFAGAICKWGNCDYRLLRKILGALTIAFLGVYAAAQFSAGSKALHVLFGWDYKVGAIMGAVIVLAYCVAGGIRASIWTDAAQSFVMIFSMGLLAVVALVEIGGFAELFYKMAGVSDNYASILPQNLEDNSLSGVVLFIGGWIFAGFGVMGQPHIMVRYMTMDDPENIGKVRAYYYGFYSVFFVLTILVGLAARILLGNIESFDAELALPTLAGTLLPEVLVGLIVAGIFAATMSTADSQILSCTAAVTHDFSKSEASFYMTKFATFCIAFIALLIALYADKSVFSLVIISWSALASTFAPLLFIIAFGGRPSEKLAIMVCLTGIGTMLAWLYFGLDQYVLEVAPGMVSGVLLYVLVNKGRIKNIG